MQKKSRQLTSFNSIQKLLQENRESFQMSTTATPRETRQTQNVFTSKNTFYVSQFMTNPGYNPTKQRIECKSGIKRITGRVLLSSGKQKNTQKQNCTSVLRNTSKAQPQRSTINIYQKNGNPDYAHTVQFKQLDKRFYSCVEQLKQSSYSDQSITSSNAGEYGRLADNKYQELFKQLKRTMLGEKELSYSLKQKKNCFYSNLKKKLAQDMNKTVQKQDLDRINVMIEGCNAHVHTKKSSYSAPKPVKRPQTAKIDFQKQCQGSISNSEKVKTCRRVQYKSAESIKVIDELKSQSNRLLNAPNTRSERDMTRDKLMKDLFATKNSIMVACTETSLRMRKSSNYKSAESLKIGQIIKDCDLERNDKEILKDNMKLFQFYCKKIDERFERATHTLNFVQNFEIQ